MPKKLDLTGQRFGRWTVLGEAGKDKGRDIYWKCRCDCGIEKEVSGIALRWNRSKSCGCISKKHGGRRDGKQERLYVVWRDMKIRCNNQNDKSYDRYGGRGIQICNDWQNDYTAFRDWALANGYAEGLQIDRIDNDGNYCPENCRWVTRKENARNTRANKKVTVNGDTKCISEWIEELNISRDIGYKIYRKGESHFIAYIQQKLAQKRKK